MLADIPADFETERLRLRNYQAGDGRWGWFVEAWGSLRAAAGL